MLFRSSEGTMGTGSCSARRSCARGTGGSTSPPAARVIPATTGFSPAASTIRHPSGQVAQRTSCRWATRARASGTTGWTSPMAGDVETVPLPRHSPWAASFDRRAGDVPLVSDSVGRNGREYRRWSVWICQADLMCDRSRGAHHYLAPVSSRWSTARVRSFNAGSREVAGRN